MPSSIPLRINSDLVNAARTEAELAERPVTAQIEHWAKLGRVLDHVLSGSSVLKVKERELVHDLGEVIALSQTAAGRAKARELILAHGKPTYAADPEDSTILIERKPDGSTRRGRFVQRQFVSVG